jgi:hypothetical protein
MTMRQKRLSWRLRVWWYRVTFRWWGPRMLYRLQKLTEGE